MERVLMDVFIRSLASPTMEDLNISPSFETDFQKLRTQLILIQELIQGRSRSNTYARTLMIDYLACEIDDFWDELNIYTCRHHIDKVPFITLLPMKFILSRKLKHVLKNAIRIPKDGDPIPPSHGAEEDFVNMLVRSKFGGPSFVPLLDGEGTDNAALARFAYLDRTDCSHFYLRIWIDVRGILDAVQTMNGILERLSEGSSSSTGSDPCPTELRALQNLLLESLLGKKYLLVLLDVTNADQAEWDKLERPLNNGSSGSRIVVTTENYRVIESMRASLLPINESIWLSHINLPPYQRLCFCYFSTFPVNYVFNRQKLIHQWIALGCIPSIYNKQMVETGEEYFDSLLSRFPFFRSVPAVDNGKFQEFIIIHESSAQIKSLFIKQKDVFASSLTYCAFHLICETVSSSSRLHSLFTHRKYLRVLNLGGCGITRLHESIGDLIHLRYLDLSNTLVQTLPNNICYLFNLQALHISDCKHLRKLPSKICNLINLQHLNIKGCDSLARMPANIGKLGNLQSLPIFIVGRKLEESLYQLKHLDLRGELEIKQLERVGYLPPDICLQYKLLHSLVFSWGNDIQAEMDHHLSRKSSKGYDSHNAESVLNCLAPNRDLLNLYINDYPGSTLPQWLNKVMLPNLTKLVLFNCRRCETLPPLGPLQSLRVLHLRGMDAVMRIGSEFFGKEHGTKLFPSLCELILSDCPALRSWESTEFMEVFPCLRKLSIINCPMLTSTPCFPSLQHLDLHNCSKLIYGSAESSNLYSSLANTLQSLEISSCPELQEFPDWMENLTSLKSLAILHCQNLKSLSEGLKHLKALERFSVRDCPHLERRCQKDIGEDWHKILHVPCVNLGSSMPQKRVDAATNSSS